MKKSFLLMSLAITVFTFSCKDKASATDPTPTFSPTNNNTQQVQDTLGFRTDSTGTKDTIK